jgi:hypothetical protein
MCATTSRAASEAVKRSANRSSRRWAPPERPVRTAARRGGCAAPVWGNASEPRRCCSPSPAKLRERSPWRPSKMASRRFSPRSATRRPRRIRERARARPPSVAASSRVRFLRSDNLDSGCSAGSGPSIRRASMPIARTTATGHWRAPSSWGRPASLRRSSPPSSWDGVAPRFRPGASGTPWRRPRRGRTTSYAMPTSRSPGRSRIDCSWRRIRSRWSRA